jgi:putative endonuclease
LGVPFPNSSSRRKPGSRIVPHEATLRLHSARKRNGTLYVGVTSDLVKRIWEHKSNLVPGFTSKYRVHDLVWFEQHETMESAILREKAIKEWKRAWKILFI